MLNIHSIVCNPFQERTYVLWGQSKAAAVIDCGCSCPAEQKRLTDIVERNGLRVVAHIATHAHLDHLFGAAWLYRTYGVPTLLHNDDLPLVERLADQAAGFGFPWIDWDFPVAPMQITQEVSAVGSNVGGVLANPSLRDSDLPRMRVIHTPGHSPGSVCLYFPDDEVLLSGDTLFSCGYGRTDLWGGSYDTLMTSLGRLATLLPPATRVYPGHGSTTTIGDELG